MNTTPPPLKLADTLDDTHKYDQTCNTAAAMLRKQHLRITALEADRKMLREALERLRHWAEGDMENYINDHPVAQARRALENTHGN